MYLVTGYNVLPQLLLSIDFPTTAPGWPNATEGSDGHMTRVDSTSVPCQTGHQTITESQSGKPTTNIGT